MKRYLKNRIYRRTVEKVFMDYYDEDIINLDVVSRKPLAESFKVRDSKEEIYHFEYLEYIEPIFEASWTTEAIASMQNRH